MTTALLGAVGLLGCGSGDDQATEQRIQRERAEAAVIAKQAEQIKQLEREQRQARAEGRRPTVTVVTPAPGRSDAVRSRPPAKRDDWPGNSAYTTILASVATKTQARGQQVTATSAGLDAGVLYSTNYRSLRPGFWVVFSGSSASKEDADRRTARAKALGYGDAYTRFVSG